MTVARRKDRTRSSRNADAGRGSTGAPKTPTLSGSQPNLVVAQVEENASVEPEALVVSHWFDPGEVGEPYPATIRLSGRRADVAGRPGPTDTFVHEETIERVVPGTGPISISSWVYGLKPGEWTVSGELIRARRAPGRVLVRHTDPLSPAAWSWRHWSVRTAPAAPIKTRWALAAPLARIPGVLPGSYTALFAVGLFVALASQLAILASEQIAVPRSVFVSLLALSAGLLGAKLWSAALHPGESLLKGGWAVDGFLVTAPLVAIVALIAFGLPVGAYLDATAPGLFFAVAIGRIGCFLTGCCAGRVTPSRWAIWSSDRRIGARRIPAQLLESAAGLLIGTAAMPLTLLHFKAVHGAVFVGAFVVYLIVRQLLLRLREEARRYSWQRSRLANEGP
jgi:phosphatidylglycerol---prolipoprotein diacylglyceryl transferase